MRRDRRKRRKGKRKTMKGAVNIFQQWRTVCQNHTECRDCPLKTVCPTPNLPGDMTDEDILRMITRTESAYAQIKAVKHET